MLVVDINSGLGNQMFYYATARALSEMLNMPFAFYSNPKMVNEGWQHKLSLEHFNVRPLEVFTDLSVLDAKGNWLQINGLRTDADAISLPKADNIFFSGNWLGEKSFSFLKEQLKRELKVKTPPSQKNMELLEELKSVNSVGVHVRNYFNLTGTSRATDHCGNGYYKKAVEIIKRRVYNPVFYVFCLELDWCKENFKIDADVIYVELDNPAYEEIRLLYSCRHLIAARSTMSWWALYLLENENGVKISPVQKAVFNEKLFTAAPLDSIALPHDDIVAYDNL